MASENVTKLIEEVKALSVLELSELVKALEEEFGVSATPVAVAGAAAGAGEAAAAEKTEFDVVLTAAGDKKINVIKVVRAVTGLGLKEGASKEDAEEIKKQLEEAGASVELK